MWAAGAVAAMSSITFPAVSALVSQSADPDKQGESPSLFSSFSASFARLSLFTSLGSIGQSVISDDTCGSLRYRLNIWADAVFEFVSSSDTTPLTWPITRPAGVVQGMITGIRGLCNGLGPALYGFVFFLFNVELNTMDPIQGDFNILPLNSPTEVSSHTRMFSNHSSAWMRDGSEKTCVWNYYSNLKFRQFSLSHGLLLPIMHCNAIKEAKAVT